MFKKSNPIINKEISDIIIKNAKKHINENNAYKYLQGIEYLYHATPACYINSIKKYGLGGKMPKTRLWNYKGTQYENMCRGCFLATDEYVAESYVENSEAFDELADSYEEQYDKELEIVVFQIKVSDLNYNLISVDLNQQFESEDDPTFFYDGVIPYINLHQIKLY